MFTNEKFIHNPNSPRQQSLEPWLKQNAVMVNNEYSTKNVNTVDIDIRDLNDQIAEGVLYVKYDNRNDQLRVIYKLKQGVYTQQGFDGERQYPIPLPDIYLLMDFKMNTFGKLSNDYVKIGSPYLNNLPLTNIYSDIYHENSMLTSDWAKMCCERVLSTMVGQFDSPNQAVNRLVASVPTFLLSKSNTDLDLFHGRDNSARDISLGLDDGGKYDRFVAYWEFLKEHWDTGKYQTPNEFYKQLAEYGIDL